MQILATTTQFNQLSPGRAAGICFLFTFLGLAPGITFWFLPPDTYAKARQRSERHNMVPGVDVFAAGTPEWRIKRTLRIVATILVLIGVASGVLGVLYLTHTLRP